MRYISPVFLLGCLLSGCGGDDGGTDTPTSTPEPTGSPSVTWHKDVATLVASYCVGCHHVDGIGPFPLETYTQASGYAGAMAASVAAGRMPPWMPAQECQRFADARVLTEEQKAMFQAWADLGAPEGDPADAGGEPPPVAELEWVDVTLQAGGDYLPPGELSDEYRCFVLEPQLTQTEYLIGYEVQPGVDTIVHHVLLYQVPAGEGETLDAGDPGVGWTCFGGTGTSESTTLGGWAPGSPPTQFPPDTGIPLDPNKSLVMQVHYNFDFADPLPDRTRVDLQFSPQVVAKEARMEKLLNNSFVIPAGASDYQADVYLDIGGEVVLYGLLPHMHALGQRTWTEVSREGEDICLLNIPQWDFHWQQGYFYDDPAGFTLQKGDRVHLACVWDNPTDTEVRWGENTTDEMCISYFYVTY